MHRFYRAWMGAAWFPPVERALAGAWWAYYMFWFRVNQWILENIGE